MRMMMPGGRRYKAKHGASLRLPSWSAIYCKTWPGTALYFFDARFRGDRKPHSVWRTGREQDKITIYIEGCFHEYLNGDG